MDAKEFFNQLPQSTVINLIGPLITQEQLNYIKNYPTIFIDGGSKVKARLKQLSHCLCVGDGDSSEEIMDVLLPERKDFSDFKYALDQLPPSLQQIHLWGFLGGRKDHEIINLGEIHHFLVQRQNQQQNVKLYLDHQFIAATGGTFLFQLQGRFSILIFENSQLQITGDCDYQLLHPQEVPALSSHLVSNVARGKIEITASKPFFIYQQDTMSAQT